MEKTRRRHMSKERSERARLILGRCLVDQDVLVKDLERTRRQCALLAMRSGVSAHEPRRMEGAIADLNEDPLGTSAVGSNEQDQITDMLIHQRIFTSFCKCKRTAMPTFFPLLNADISNWN